MESLLDYRTDFDRAACENLPALFIPLKTEYYEQFKAGTKRDELRLYGKRWNEKTCRPGRNVLLSKGYGTGDRMKGNISAFKKQHGTTFGQTYRNAIEHCYGTLDVWIACISIDELRRITP